MKVFVLTGVLLSICYGLNARCLQSNSDSCPLRVFNEPESRPIRYIYHSEGENCNCQSPQYHDLIVQKPEVEEKTITLSNYDYNIAVPQNTPKEDDKITRYMFDVRVEKPIEKPAQESIASYDYKVQEAPAEKIEHPNSVRYIFDSRVEQPIKPCDEKPWQGLVAQIDTIVMPSRGCSNPSHTSETCNCGCRNSSHTPSSCDCHKNNNIFNYSPNYEVYKRTKRDNENKKSSSLKSKQREFKLPKMKSLKKIDPTELSAMFKVNSLRQKKLPPAAMKLELPLKKFMRSKRRETSPCGYTFETCDLKRKTPASCPLCYKCKCEPAEESENQRFSTKNIKVPYKIVSHDQEFSPATQQEYDYVPSAYTGLKKQDMYKQYIEQIISKYPEHMARQMPDLKEQQTDLLNFINELARNDKSPRGKIENEDIRYKVIDNAVEFYKMYENAIGKKPKSLGKPFNKRGTIVEVIDVDADDFEENRKLIGAEDFSDNFSN